MSVGIITAIAICSVVAAFCVFMMCFAVYAQNKGFGGRFEKNGLLKYFSAEEFSLNVKDVETKAGGTILKGVLYWAGDEFPAERLIIFSHGMGPGQCAYTSLIAHFCRKGCAVLAFDCFGCGLSGGRSLGGLENSTRALVAAVKFADSCQELKDLKKTLVGHSMGAYSALAASKFVKVDSVVAFSAPEQPSRMVERGAAEVTGKIFAMMLQPFVKVVTFFRFGKFADLRAARCAAKSGTPSLIIHGSADCDVPVRLSACFAAKNMREKKSSDIPLSVMLCVGKRHNPYNTFKAEQLLKELKDGLFIADKMNEEERSDFFSTRDYSAICEEDNDVLDVADRFIESH